MKSPEEQIENIVEDMFTVLDKHEYADFDTHVGAVMVLMGVLLAQYDRKDKPHMVRLANSAIAEIAYNAEVE